MIFANKDLFEKILFSFNSLGKISGFLIPSIKLFGIFSENFYNVIYNL